jgi:hypothetical protein
MTRGCWVKCGAALTIPNTFTILRTRCKLPKWCESIPTRQGHEAHWMKGQLALISKACAKGNTADASRRLTEVRKMLAEHRRAA